MWPWLTDLEGGSGDCLSVEPSCVLSTSIFVDLYILDPFKGGLGSGFLFSLIRRKRGERGVLQQACCGVKTFLKTKQSSKDIVIPTYAWA